MANRVWNRRDPNCPKDAIYIGRPSKYGNPYTHIRGRKTSAKFTVDTVEEAISNYRHALAHGELGLTQADFDYLRGKDLICWCAHVGFPLESNNEPWTCHGQVLLEYLEKGYI